MFGEQIEGYNGKVLNERENRAGAGILFIFGMTSFFNSFLTQNFLFTKIFIVAFMIDFFIRVIINPKYSPSLILGRLAVGNQEPEYTSAEPKRFAWGIGLVLSIVMFFLVVVFEVMTPFKIIICFLCLGFLFLETSFGVCIGCKIYAIIYKKKPLYCPGGICNIKEKSDITKVSKKQIATLFLFLLFISTLSIYQINNTPTSSEKTMKCQTGKCGI